MELYIKGEPEIPSAQLNKKLGKLSGKFNYDKKGIEGYDKDGNRLDKLGVVYKKEETGVEIVGYNQNRDKLDDIFAEYEEDSLYPIFDKKGNILFGKYKN